MRRVNGRQEVFRIVEPEPKSLSKGRPQVGKTAQGTKPKDGRGEAYLAALEADFAGRCVLCGLKVCGHNADRIGVETRAQRGARTSAARRAERMKRAENV